MELKGSLLEFKKLGFQYGSKEVFADLNLSIGKGEVVGLLGLSGSGKSTLLKLACGLLRPNQGEVLKSPQLSNWGYLSQGLNLIPWLNVNDNLKLVANRDPKAWDRARDWLEKFRLTSSSTRYPYELSGGMVQKVAFIRAFLHNPEVVLLDEPFTHLDLPQKEELYDFAKQLWTQTSATVLMVSHDIDEVLMLAKTIYICSQRSKNLIPTEVHALSTTSLAQLRQSEPYPQSYGHLLDFLRRELIHA